MKKEIISKFKEKPKTKTAWWAMGLGLSVMFSGPILGIFAAVIRPLIDKTGGERLGIMLGFVMIFLVFSLLIAALTTSLRSFRAGERSWALWVGFVPAIFACLFWIFMIIGEFLFPH